MIDGEPIWARVPLQGTWRRVLKSISFITFPGSPRRVPGPIQPVYRLGDVEAAQLADEQRRRARDLASLMGFQSEISDNHAARIVQVLSPFIPGLTIANPSAVYEYPEWLGARWQAPKVGAKMKWTEDRKRSLLSDVDRLKKEGRAQTDKEALSLVLATITQQGGTVVSVERLQNLLAEARRLCKA